MTHRATAALDRMLVAHGQAVTLRRRIGTGSAYVEVEARAKVWGFRAEQLVGTVKQTDSAFILSPTPIRAAAAAGDWPGAAGGGPWPQTSDWLVIEGKMRKIEAIANTVLDDQVVRIEGRVLG